MDYYGRMSTMDQAQSNLTVAQDIISKFERQAVNGGKLELEIDRYGHTRLTLTINPSENYNNPKENYDE